MATYIYIDDTGTAQTRSSFKYDTSMSTSWCAVLFDDRVFSEASAFMKKELAELDRFIGLDEFHFTEIFNNKGKYRTENIDWEDRLNIFLDFAAFSAENQFPVFIQTFGEDDYARINLKNDETYVVENFKVSDYKDFSLCALLFQVRFFLDSHPEYSAPYRIIIDEGKQKKGSTQRCSIFGDRLEHRQIVYKSSSDDSLLQLADFAAFTLNRCRWLNMNGTTTWDEYDIQFLRMAEYANFNGPFLVKAVLPIDCDRKEVCGKLMDNALKFNENLAVEKVRDFIDKTYKP